MDLKMLTSQTPKENSRFVAFFHDGSGATLFVRLDDGTYLEAEGDEYSGDLFDAGYSHWEYLPDNFQLWFEQRDEDRS